MGKKVKPIQCEVPHCTAPHYARGRCVKHYKRLSRGKSHRAIAVPDLDKNLSDISEMMVRAAKEMERIASRLEATRQYLPSPPENDASKS